MSHGASFARGLDRWRATRAEYELYLETQYARALDECAGVLLSRDAKDIDPYSLFMGPHARAQRWASEELKDWWLTNGRVTFAQFEEAFDG